MKWLKRIAIGVIGFFILFFAFYGRDAIKLDGEWDIKTIVLNGKPLYAFENDVHLSLVPKLSISGWGDITIPTADKEINAHFKIKDKVGGAYTVHLSSKEKSLNGAFTLKLDTIHLGSRSYKVIVEMESGTTLLHFKRSVNIGQWRPPFPKKGAV